MILEDALTCFEDPVRKWATDLLSGPMGTCEAHGHQFWAALGHRIEAFGTYSIELDDSGALPAEGDLAFLVNLQEDCASLVYVAACCDCPQHAYRANALAVHLFTIGEGGLVQTAAYDNLDAAYEMKDTLSPSEAIFDETSYHALRSDITGFACTELFDDDIRVSQLNNVSSVLGLVELFGSKAKAIFDLLGVGNEATIDGWICVPLWLVDLWRYLNNPDRAALDPAEEAEMIILGWIEKKKTFANSTRRPPVNNFHESPVSPAAVNEGSEAFWSFAKEATVNTNTFDLRRLQDLDDRATDLRCKAFLNDYTMSTIRTIRNDLLLIYAEACDLAASELGVSSAYVSRMAEWASRCRTIFETICERAENDGDEDVLNLAIVLGSLANIYDSTHGSLL